MKAQQLRRKYHGKSVFRSLGGILIMVFLVCTAFEFAVAKSKFVDFDDSYLTDIEMLGKQVFWDKISVPQRMACVTCHNPKAGWTFGVAGVNQHQVAVTGANPHTVGNIKTPSNAYATFIRPFEPCGTGGLGPQNVCGGTFWNGRAEGNKDAIFPDGATKHIGEEILFTTEGTPLPAAAGYAVYFGPVADQALNPMPNIVEQNIDRKAVCEHVATSKYARLYESVWGVEIDCSDTPVEVSASDVDQEMVFDISFKRIMLAVCAYQHSYDVNSFSSKRDKALRAELACACSEGAGSPNYPGNEICGIVGDSVDHSVCQDVDYVGSPGRFPLAGLTEEENYGHDLFYATRFNPRPNGKFSNCAFCHSDNPVLPGPGPKDTGDELFQLYSADDYHNIGTPGNPEIPDTGVDPDLGVAGHAGPNYPGGFVKTPTLRNVCKGIGEGFTKAYAHNGWFKSVESIVHFYNTAFTDGATAAEFGIKRCPPDIETEKDALANNCWPAPAYGLDDGGPSAIPFLVGDLGLTIEDEAAIVAYLNTLADEHTAKAPKPYK